MYLSFMCRPSKQLQNGLSPIEVSITIGKERRIIRLPKYIRAEDVPGKTMFVITTDGLENASREYSGPKVKKMIEKKKEEGWNFIFLASNIDAAEAADNLGVGAANAAQFEATAAGSRKMFAKACCEISEYRAKK